MNAPIAAVLLAVATALVMSLTWWRRGGALLPLALAVVALSPVAVVAWLGAAWSRRTLTRPGRVRRSLRAVGLAALTQGCDVKARRIEKGRMNAVLIVTLTRPGEAPRLLVLKHLLAFGTLLGWAARAFGATREYPRAQGTSARTSREARASLLLHRLGFASPACLGFSVRERVVAVDYVEGRPLAEALGRSPALVEQLGVLLARMHTADYSTGDPNPENMLVDSTGRIVPLDLEQSHFGAGATCTRKGFDVAWAGAFLATDADRERLLAAYGPRSPELEDAIRIARAHLDRFAPIVEHYGRRWRAAGPREERISVTP